MKRAFLLSIILLLAKGLAFSQVCFPTTSNPTKIFSPNSDVFPCVVSGSDYGVNIKFHVPKRLDGNILGIGNLMVGVDSIRLDSISNLPNGFSYFPANQDNTIQLDSTTCIFIIGNTSIANTVLTLDFHATIWTDLTIVVQASPQMLRGLDSTSFDLRIISSGTNCPNIVDSNTVAGFTGFTTIRGNVFYDENGNGINDGNDSPFSNVEVYIGPNTAYTNKQGEFYSHITNTGTYNLNVDAGLNYSVSTSPATQQVNIVNLTDTIAPFTIGISPNSLFRDLGISLTSGPTRPGFTTNHWISYQNIGTQIIDSGSVKFAAHPLFSYILANPTYDIQTGTNATWNFTNLLPGETRTIAIQLLLTATAIDSFGATISNIAAVFPLTDDVDTTNNLSINDMVITGSYDPNDKTAYPTGDLSEAFINSGDPLRYRIRFQNTGTDTAFTVVVRDTLDITKYDVSSLNMLGSSHNYNLTIENGTYAVWTFNNILLPDSNVNEPGSHGFLMFEIDLLPSVTDGQTIENMAGIYFDFNPVVLTNTATSKVDFSIGITEMGSNNLIAKLYPNPTTGLVNIEFNNTLTTYNLTLFDLSGKALLSFKELNGSNAELNLSCFESGMYFFVLTDEAGKSSTGKLLINR